MASKKDFKVGDKVKFINRNDGDMKYGSVGKVVHITDSIGVEWNKNVGGHSCDHHCCYGYGWYVFSNDLIHISNKEFNVVNIKTTKTFLLLIGVPFLIIKIVSFVKKFKKVG